MLVDEVTITVKAGNGGNGSVNFKRNGQTAKGGPDGGNGGNGGSVHFQGVNDITALSVFSYKKVIEGEDGVNGGRQNLYGRNGKDLIVKVPIGTFVTDLISKETFEIKDEDTKILVASGGKGGRGNNEFKSATNQTPMYAEPGEPGEAKKLFLELKLVADIGLIGLPNSGKSTLLSILTNAHPKIGDYPFTTLEPNLGVYNGLIISDIPGLIEGASKGKGLGDKFLKHVEKTKILVHCIDSNSQDIKKDYKLIRKELEDYNPELLKKREIVLLTKKDTQNEKTLKEKLNLLKKLNKRVFAISVFDDASISYLRPYLEEVS